MLKTWDEKVDDFWAAADDSAPEAALQAMRSLVAQRPENDPDAVFEWASVHDFLGREEEAIPLYRAALESGLTGARRSRAIIQLASSLRNVGDADAAVALLSGEKGDDETTGSAARAFLALALHDSGRHDEALRVALVALAPTLPLYGRAIESYAGQLTVSSRDAGPDHRPRSSRA